MFSATLSREIETLTEKLAPQLLDQPGVGPLLAAQVVLSWSHKGRIRSEAAFARLAGVAPITASRALNTPDRNTFFAPPTAQGYIDYPTLATA